MSVCRESPPSNRHVIRRLDYAIALMYAATDRESVACTGGHVCLSTGGATNGR